MKFYIKRTFPIIVAVAALYFGTSCNRDKFQGPQIKEATQSFALTEEFKPTTKSISFIIGQNPTIGFSAQFNEEVSYEVAVTGLTSGAVKTWKGVGMGFSENEIVWEGRSSGIPFYRPFEYVKATLSISGRNEIYTIDSIQMLGAYYYHKKMINGVKHIAVAHFEGSAGNLTSKVYKQVDAYAGADQADGNTVFLGPENSNVVEGEKSFRMRGQDLNNNSWLGGMNNANLVDFYLVESVNQLEIDSGIDEHDLYVNAFVYGTGMPNTAIQFKIYELDYKTTYGDTALVPIKNRAEMRKYIFAKDLENNPIARIPYDQSQNDGWIFDLEVTWTGWKLVSIPYSKFRAANDLNAGGNGDRKKESWRIAGMSISLLSYPTSGAMVDTYIDYVTITTGGEFQQ